MASQLSELGSYEGKEKVGLQTSSDHHVHLLNTISWFALHFQNISEQASLRIPYLSLASPLLKFAHGVGNLPVFIPYLSVLVHGIWRPRGWTAEQRQNKEQLLQSYFWGKKIDTIYCARYIWKIMYNTKACGNRTSFGSHIYFAKGFLCRNSCKKY